MVRLQVNAISRCVLENLMPAKDSMEESPCTKKY